VHRTKWPELYAQATNRTRRRRAMASLTPLARKLLALVERRGELRMDDPAAAPLRKERVALEKALLVHSTQVHSESGNHVSVLVSWKYWAAQALDHQTKGKRR
jgi:hypothetical protein